MPIQLSINSSNRVDELRYEMAKIPFFFFVSLRLLFETLRECVKQIHPTNQQRSFNDGALNKKK